MNRQILIDAISASSKLPVLPHSATQLIALADDPNLYAAQLEAVIAGDPVLAARILHVSNSAMFARRNEVTNLGAAITLLGVRLALDLATGIAIVDSLRDTEKYEFDYDTFWRKSVLSAIAANEMYGDLNVASRGDLFVAALLQDIGMLVLLTTIGPKYGQLVSSARSHFDLVELELRAFGIDHAEIGAMLAKRWNLPVALQEAIQASHALFAEPPAHDLSDLQYGVAFAGVLAELWVIEELDQDVSNRAIHEYLSKVGEEKYQNTIESILHAIPGANNLFNMQLLSDEQMASVA